ncbi:hypothetical protein [Bradyrhizobium sp.]|uniref:hypothetical protein n=1 Tax=Bradyrhizobium sp. TaxID=376 RepID=UPI003C6FA715
MKPEFPKIDQDKMISPHAQEVEYALILQRMINTVQDDPAQLRMTIYEFARARLKLDTSRSDETEQLRLLDALETAIQGVEDFSVRREDIERVSSHPAARIGGGTSPGGPPSTAVATVGPVTPAREDILLPQRVYLHAGVQPAGSARARTLVPMLVLACVGLSLAGVIVGAVYYDHRLQVLGDRVSQLTSAKAAKQAAAPPGADASRAAATAEVKPGAVLPSPLPFPVPGDYGIYALNGGQLSELQLLPGRVPDKRIAMSAPVTQPSHTTLPDGKVRFILFRRDLAGNAPDRIDVRVIARVVRALTFDANGKPGFSPVMDAWNIRNVAYELRVRPIAGNPEMLLVQSEKPDFALPAGRYALVLKDQGFDFTVAGKITDLAQCLERTDAANGEFYSECQKP